MNGEVGAAIMRVARGPGDVASTTRSLLDFLQKATGVESTYFTVIHWEEAKQEVLVANNAGDLIIDEGILVDWCDTLCRRALMGGPNVTTDVPGVYADSDTARELGLVCYASVPVTMADGSIYGTLCGASGRITELDDDTLALFRFAAGMIAAQLDRDHRVGADRERALAAERRFRAQTVALASAQHQLKTPLAVLSGWADVLGRPDALGEDDWREAADAAGRQVRRLREAVDALLATALDDREPALDLRVMDIAPRLAEIVADHRRATPLRAWSTHLPEVLLAAIDPAAFEQAIAHLLDNAVKYSDDDSAIVVDAHRTSDEVVLVISDNGIGVPDDTDGLFEPFARNGQSRRDSAGLGLYIVRNIVNAHHGTVTASRRAPRGSRFEVRLPAARL